jgi:carboxylesterase
MPRMAEAPNRQLPTAPLSLPADPDRNGGRSVGVLLVHGFTGSPASMKPWASALAEHGYAVEVPLLPGHGTRWQDLNRASWTEWYAGTEAAFDRLRTTCEAVVVAGLSMGGCLALRLAEERGEQVAGIVLVNPFLSSNRRELALLPVLKFLVPSLRGVVNDIRKPDQDEHGYHRLPLKALAQVTSMWKVVVPDLDRVAQPLLYFRSEDDHVIDASSSATIRHGVSSSDIEERTLGESFHVATLDHDAERIVAESAEFVARVTAATASSA